MNLRFAIPAGAVVALLAAGPLAAQTWEIGGGAGFGVVRELGVSSGNLSGKMGLRHGYLATAYGGHHLYSRLSGELRYSYRKGSPKVSSGGEQAEMKGEAHTVAYDFLLHARDRDAGVRPYLAFGGGVKVYRGTGIESAFQPLNRFILLTSTQHTLPLVSVGGGVSVRLPQGAVLRFDFRDHVTPFPSKVLQPAPGAQASGWLHDFLPMVTVGVTF
jgi:hypothetical protein